MKFKHTKEITISRRCAIHRPGLTKPLRDAAAGRIADIGWGQCALHVGEGRALHDTALLQEYTGERVTVFDPNFDVDRPELRGGRTNDPSVLDDEYDIIWCCYVANVLPPAERAALYQDMADALSIGGRAFIAVRSTADHSIKGTPEQDGVRTSTGTFQKAYTVETFLAELKPYFEYTKVDLPERRRSFILVEVWNG